MATGRNKYRDEYFVDGLKTDQMKTYAMAIDPGSDDRIKFLFEANNDAEHGEKCLKSVFVYIGSSATPLYAVELPSTWDSAWDDEAEAIAVGLGYTTKPE